MNSPFSLNASSDTRSRWLRCLPFCAFLLTLSGIVAAQTDAGALPSHAHASRYGTGWDCLQGYAREAQACVRIEIPPNAYLNYSRNQWECSCVLRDVGAIPTMLPAQAAPLAANEVALSSMLLVSRFAAFRCTVDLANMLRRPR